MNNTRALNRHARGWALVMPLSSDIFTRLVTVYDPEYKITYPVSPENLKNPVTLPNKIRESLKPIPAV